MSDTPKTETAPIGPATQLLLVQFAQLQQAGLAQLAIAAASADQKSRDAGWQLDVERRVWVRPAPDPAPSDKPAEVPDGA